MPKEYKTLTFDNSPYGHQQMARTINDLAKDGWEVKSKEVIDQGYSFGKTCCLGCLFLPLALLGKKQGVVQVIMERNN